MEKSEKKRMHIKWNKKIRDEESKEEKGQGITFITQSLSFAGLTQMGQ